jgi:rifampicin phosphotransferase
VSTATQLLTGGEVDPAMVGGKAYALNWLLRIGAPVPAAGVITTEGYRSFITASGLDRFLADLRAEGVPDQADVERAAERVDTAFLEATMPGGLADDIRRLAESVRSGGRLAVRSSATAEDMAAASFAGQYRSFLDIGDEEGLMRAVRLVWSSLWHAAPRAYRAHANVPEDDLAMAVVVMRLVDAQRAGVAFTVDPGGVGTELRVEAVEGLAEGLVSGEVTPDAYVVSRTMAHQPPVDPIIEDVIRTALGIERAFGAPQDVEWAHDGAQLFVVQSRPITALPAVGTHDGFDTPIGSEDTYTTAGIAESLPGVLPPLQWSTVAPLLEDGLRHLFDQMRALPALADRRPFLARVNGRAVLSLDLMKAAALEIPGGSSDEIERQYFGRIVTSGDDGRPSIAPLRGPFRGVRRMLVGVREIRARRHVRFDAEVSIDTIQRILAKPPDCDVATIEQLLAYRHRVLDLADRVVAAEVAAAAAAAAAFRGVELFLETHVGAEAGALAQQLTAGGIDPCGAQIALRTCDLAEQALLSKELSAALEGLGSDQAAARDMLAQTAGGCELLAEIDEELGRAGSTAVFAGETWAEAEDLAWRLISQAVQVARRGRPEMTDPSRREDLLARTEARLAAGWKWRTQRLMTGQIVDLRRRMLRRLVADAVEFLQLRERTKSAVLALGGEVRRIHLAIGRRLHQQGALTEPTHVDLLAASELEAASRGQGPTHWELRRRAAVLELLTAAPALPQVFTGNPGRSTTAPPALDANDVDTFSGWAASGGSYEGPARVIIRATDHIDPGDVLVARTTDPSWTPLFLTAGAIVVEEGGPLSHAAIIARELQLPAVLNLPGILDRLGGLEQARLHVDGTAGTVRIVDHETRAEPAGTSRR